MDTTQEHEYASNTNLDSDFSDWISDDSKESDSEFDQARGLDHILSESDDFDYDVDQSPDSAINPVDNTRSVIQNNPPQTRNKVLNETESMVDFDMMRSSLPAEPIVDAGFLTSAANSELATTRAISTKMTEVKAVCQAINEQFNVKARPWQVSVVIDITKQKREVCAIAGTNAGKSLVYQSIPVITGGSVLVISPTIALMEDQVCYVAGHLTRRYILLM